MKEGKKTKGEGKKNKSREQMKIGRKEEKRKTKKGGRREGEKEGVGWKDRRKEERMGHLE